MGTLATILFAIVVTIALIGFIAGTFVGKG